MSSRVGNTYRHKSDGTLWEYVGHYVACQYPHELRGDGYTIYVTYGELRDDYELVEEAQ